MIARAASAASVPRHRLPADARAAGPPV